MNKFFRKTAMIGIFALSVSTFYAQVGINNSDPKATLEVTAKTTNGTRPEGIIAPRLTGDQLKLADGQYTSAQTGTIVYVSSAVNVSSAKTININSPGYYYFDGSIWQKFTDKKNIYTSDGTVGSNRLVGIADNINFDNGTFFIDGVNNKIGIGTSAPTVKLEVNNGSAPGAIRIVDGSQAEGRVLTSDVNGVARWGTINSIQGELVADGITVISERIPNTSQIKIRYNSITYNIWKKVFQGAGNCVCLAWNNTAGYQHRTTIWAIGDDTPTQLPYYGLFFNDVYYGAFDGINWSTASPLPDRLTIWCK